MCSNQDGFPSVAYVCSNNLHVSGNPWPLASIRCYFVVPSERLRHPLQKGPLLRDLPQLAWRGGGMPGRRKATVIKIVTGAKEQAASGSRWQREANGNQCPGALLNHTFQNNSSRTAQHMPNVRR